MINGKRICVVFPAYNAEETLEQTVRGIPAGIVDSMVLVDDASHDQTVAKARSLGLDVVVHERNRGYGGNQKTCYREALERGADIVVMLHPDYQYAPELVPALASLVASGLYDIALGSRILGGGALQGGMPLYKYVSNRALTLVQNWLLGQKLSEYHTGFRAFSKAVLETLPLEQNSEQFLFDNQMLAQSVFAGFKIGEISCPTRYFPEASSISFWPALRYGLGVLTVSLFFRAAQWGLFKARMFLTIQRGARGCAKPAIPKAA